MDVKLTGFDTISRHKTKTTLPSSAIISLVKILINLGELLEEEYGITLEEVTSHIEGDGSDHEYNVQEVQGIVFDNVYEGFKEDGIYTGERDDLIPWLMSEMDIYDGTQTEKLDKVAYTLKYLVLEMTLHLNDENAHVPELPNAISGVFRDNLDYYIDTVNNSKSGYKLTDCKIAKVLEDREKDISDVWSYDVIQFEDDTRIISTDLTNLGGSIIDYNKLVTDYYSSPTYINARFNEANEAKVVYRLGMDYSKCYSLLGLNNEFTIYMELVIPVDIGTKTFDVFNITNRSKSKVALTFKEGVLNLNTNGHLDEIVLDEQLPIDLLWNRVLKLSFTIKEDTYKLEYTYNSSKLSLEGTTFTTYGRGDMRFLFLGPRVVEDGYKEVYIKRFKLIKSSITDDELNELINGEDNV